jgi:hypothetical protein
MLTMKKKVKSVSRKKSEDSSEITMRQLVAVVGLFVVLGIFVSVIGTPADVNVTGQATGPFNYLNKLLVGESQFDVSFLKWTFFIVLTLVFFSVFSAIKWPEGKFVMWLISVPLAFISMTLINTADLLTSIQGYSAIGLTFISIIPIAGMVLFSSQLLSQGKITTGKIIFQLILWWYFLAFYIYAFVSYWFSNPTIAQKGVEGVTKISTLSDFVILINLVPIGLILLIIFGNKKYRKWIRELGRELTEEIGRDVHAADKMRKMTAGDIGV